MACECFTGAFGLGLRCVGRPRGPVVALVDVHPACVWAVMRVVHFCQIEPELVIGSLEIFDLLIAIPDRLFHAINEMLAVQMVWISFDPCLGLCLFW